MLLHSPDLAARIGLPTTTTGRLLEELHAHGLVKRTVGSNVNRWSIASMEVVEAMVKALGLLAATRFPKSQ